MTLDVRKETPIAPPSPRRRGCAFLLVTQLAICVLRDERLKGKRKSYRPVTGGASWTSRTQVVRNVVRPGTFGGIRAVASKSGGTILANIFVDVSWRRTFCSLVAITSVTRRTILANVITNVVSPVAFFGIRPVASKTGRTSLAHIVDDVSPPV